MVYLFNVNMFYTMCFIVNPTGPHGRTGVLMFFCTSEIYIEKIYCIIKLLSNNVGFYRQPSKRKAPRRLSHPQFENITFSWHILIFRFSFHKKAEGIIESEIMSLSPKSKNDSVVKPYPSDGHRYSSARSTGVCVWRCLCGA